MIPCVSMLWLWQMSLRYYQKHRCCLWVTQSVRLYDHNAQQIPVSGPSILGVDWLCAVLDSPGGCDSAFRVCWVTVKLASGSLQQKQGRQVHD